ncbi:MAG: hypothetical protein P1V18_02775 [Candidatus Gracilibacteria bacterium]|nr:hypothetical protein [Candidatus Gracilibacteria bacterium]
MIFFWRKIMALIRRRTAFIAGITALFLMSLVGQKLDIQNIWAAPGDTFRVSEYFLSSGTYTGTAHNLMLDQDLTNNYFVIIQGSDGDTTSNNDRGPDENYVALSADPFGSGDLPVSAGTNVLGLTRNNSVNSWVGVVTVIECVTDCNNTGFKLLDVQQVISNGVTTSGNDTSDTNWSDINQVMLMGGFNGAGCHTAESSSANSKVCHTRFFPSGSNLINWSRNNAGATLSTSTSTVMVLEWGAEWNVQRVNVTGTAGGNGANTPGEYNTAVINSVARENTWVWGTGHTTDQGIGDAAEGTIITLGNGVDTNPNEATVAIGQEYNDTKNFEVYALTHEDLLVDYRFKTDGDVNALTFDQSVNVANDGSARMALSYNGLNGTGNAYPRPHFSARYTSNNTIRLERRRFGQNFPAWIQGIDFSNIVPGVDLSTSTKTDNDVDNNIVPGQTITYSITLINSGLVNATGLDIDDVVNTNLENVDVQSITNCGGALTDNSTAAAINIDNADVNVGVNCVVVFTADVKAGLGGGTLIPNTAQISASNEGSAAFSLNSPNLMVNANSDLEVTITADQAEVAKNAPLEYTITVTNNGPSDTTNVTISDVLPSGVSFDSSLASQGAFDENTGLWTVGILLNGNTATLKINVTSDDDAGASVTNTAALNLSIPADFNIANSVDSVMTLITGGGSSGGGGGRRNSFGICGNGKNEANEQCDDGNIESGDGCSSSCQMELEVSFLDNLANSAPSAEVTPELIEAPEIDPAIELETTLLFTDQTCTDDPRYNVPDSGERCLMYDEERPLLFSDIENLGATADTINTLKNTQIKTTGEYVFSGSGNHSSGNEEGVFSEGDWPFSPLSNVSRIEVVKTLMITNCLPIADKIPAPRDEFRFKDIPQSIPPSDEMMHYTARVMYSAYLHGVITGYEDGMARPFEPASFAEVITMLTRASHVIPNDYAISDANWYRGSLEFVKKNNIRKGIGNGLKDPVSREDYATMLMRIMAFNPNPEVFGYVQELHGKTTPPQRDLSSFDQRPEQCQYISPKAD